MNFGGVDWSAGYNLEAALAGLFGLWLMVTGGRSERAEAEAERVADPGTPEYEKKLARMRKRYPEHFVFWRLLGAAMLGGCGWYLSSQLR